MNLSPRALRVIPLTIVLLICLGLLAVVTRQVVRAMLEANNASQLQAGEAIGVRPWMTIPYIARTYNVPEETLYAAIGIAASPPNSHAPLEVIARREGRRIDDEIAKLNAVIDHAQPPPPRWTPPPFSPATPMTPQATP